MRLSRISVVSLACLSFLQVGETVAYSSGQRAMPKSFPAGVWSGPHARMEVSAAGAEIEFDCGTGKVSGPLLLHTDGRFRAKGTYAMEMPGPTRVDDIAANATYTGILRGNRLRLDVTISGQKEPMSFDLLRGQHGHPTRCK